MFPFPEFHILFFFLLLGSLAIQPTSQSSSIYEVLQSYGLPMGLFPKGVKNFTLTSSGKFEVHLDHACNAKFENELNYDVNITGNLTNGQIHNLTGISAQDLFLWFPVKEIRVDIPSTGLIYFDVGVVFKQFPLSSFENLRDCTANQLFDSIHNRKIIKDTLLKTSQSPESLSTRDFSASGVLSRTLTGDWDFQFIKFTVYNPQIQVMTVIANKLFRPSNYPLFVVMMPE